MANMIPISTVTVGSGGTSFIEFANIPQNYTDLVLKVSGRGSNAAVNSPILIQVNSTASGYTAKSVYGTGSAAASDTNPYSSENKLFVGEATGSTATASVFGIADIYIPNYTGTTNKLVSSDSTTENNATTSYPVLSASQSTVTSAITNLKLYTYGSNTWDQYSTAHLYGIRKY